MRHRKWELVARILDALADSLGAVYRLSVTSWGASAQRPPSGALFSDISPLAGLLRAVAAAHDGDVYDAGGGHRRASDLGPLGKLRHDKSMSRGNHPVTAGSGQRVALQNPATADPYSRQSTR